MQTYDESETPEVHCTTLPSCLTSSSWSKGMIVSDFAPCKTFDSWESSAGEACAGGAFFGENCLDRSRLSLRSCDNATTSVGETEKQSAPTRLYLLVDVVHVPLSPLFYWQKAA